VSEARQDPWGDVPRWSDGETPAAEPSPEPVEAAATESAVAGHAAPATGGSPGTCPWCATPAAESATRCRTCGAALAQRESIGDLVIPGLTAVDPALKDLDGRPIHLRGPSPSQGVASSIIVAAAAGGPVGLAILGGVGAIAATEYLGAVKGKGHEHLGETSEAVLQAVERLDRGETLPTANDATPRPELARDGTGRPDNEEGFDGQ